MIKLDSLQARQNSDGVKQYFYIAKAYDNHGEPVYVVYASTSLEYPNGIYLEFDGKKDFNAGGEVYGIYSTQGEASKAITAYGKKA